MLSHKLSAKNRDFLSPVLIDNIIVMIVVGTALNIINQGDAIFTGSALNWPKLLLTYLMPFAVASYASWKVIKANKT